MAFQSALAGVIAAANLLASAPVLRPNRPAVRSVINLMRELPKRINLPARKGGAGAARCICQDPDYLDVYREKFEIQ